MPDVTHSPGQQPVPTQQRPEVAPNTPLPQPDQTTIDVRQLEPLSTQPLSKANVSTAAQRAASSKARPEAEAPSALRTNVFSLAGPYRAPHVPNIPAGSLSRLQALMRDGKLYLTLHDAIALAIENNLDVEVSRYNLLLADTDLIRAQGGGNLRGIDYTVVQPPAGVGADDQPSPQHRDDRERLDDQRERLPIFRRSIAAGSSAQQNLSQNGTSTYSGWSVRYRCTIPRSPVRPGYFRRSDQNSLIGLTGTGTHDNTAPQDFVSTGDRLSAGVFVGYATRCLRRQCGPGALRRLDRSTIPSMLRALRSPSRSPCCADPAARVNLRFIRIAQLDQNASRLVFEQQVLETIYGISRLYYDLVSLGENVGVQEESLAAAQRLYEDDATR